MNRFYTLLFCVVLSFLATNQALAQKTWTNGNNSGNWFDDDNWDPAGTPGAGDAVIFDGAVDDDCFISGGAECASITVQAGYSGTISFDAASTISCGGAAIFTGGTIDFSGSDVSSLGATTVNGGTFTGGTATQIVIGGTLTISSGIFSCPSGELTLDHSTATIISFTGGSFNHNNGLVTLTLGASSCTIPTGMTFNDLTIVNPSTSVSRTLNIGTGTTTVLDDIAFSSQSTRTITLAGTGSNINVGGDIDASGHNGTGSPSHVSTITLNASSGTQTIIGASSVGQGRLPAIIINQSGTATTSLSGSINVAGNWTYQGTSSVSAGSSTVTLYGTRNLDAQGTSSTMAFNNLNIGSAGGTASVTLTGSVQANGALVINSGSTLTTSSNAVTLGGDFTNGGTLTPANTIFTLTGTNAQSIDFRNASDITLNTLVCNKTSNTATISDAIRISDSLTCTGGTINLNGNVTFLSTSSKTAQIGRSTGTISGNAIVQRFIPVATSGRKWRFIASSVNTTNNIENNWQLQTPITGAGTGGTACNAQGDALSKHTSTGFHATNTNTASMFVWNATSQAWESVASTNGTNLATGTGYRMFLRGTLAQGCSILHQSPVSGLDVTLSATGTVASSSTISCSSTANGWTLVGNPHQATINLDVVTRSNVNNGFHVYNPTSSSYNAYINGVGTGSATNLLSPGQAFFIRTAANGAASVSFPETSKGTSAQGFSLFKNSSSAQYFNLNLNYNNSYADDIAIRFNDQATTQFDGDYDAEKFSFPGAGLLAAYNRTSSTRYAIYSDRITSQDTILLHLNVAAANNTYSFEATGLSRVSSNLQIFLLDKFTNTIQNLRSNPLVSFSTNSNPASVGDNRFAIVFSSNQSALPVNLAYFNGKKLMNAAALSWSTASELNASHFVVERSFDNKHFEAIGEVKATGNSTVAAFYDFADTKANFSGINYYRLKMVDVDTKSQYSGTVTVDYTDTKAGLGNEIKIFPVPAQTTLNVDLKAVNGFTTVKIYSITGVLVHTADVAGGQVAAIALTELNKGIYFVELQNNGKAIFNSKFIKQ